MTSPAFSLVYSPKSQRGMALIVVLWMLAALSLFAAGLGSQVRDQASQALVQRHLVQGRAVGEAALWLALEQLQRDNRRPGAEVVQVAFAGQPVAVQFQPWSGLVNINRASEGLWAALLMGATQMPRSHAQALGQAIVAQRQQLDRTETKGWETPQDLLGVSGMTYPVYARLVPYVVASTDTRTTVSQDMAPPPLRTWLQAAAPEYLQASADNGKFYTVVAHVPIPDQGTVLVQRSLAWDRQASTGLPWALFAPTTMWRPVGSPSDGMP